MSCCGGRSRGSVSLPHPGNSAAAHPAERPTLSVFRYEGDKTLAVTGGATGKRYVFVGPGAEVAVDIRDRASVRQVPRLRELRTV